MTEPIKKTTSNASRKRRGRDTEHMVARHIAARGWPHALATGAGAGGRDITGMPGIAPEIKARTGFEPLANLRQATHNAKGDVPIVILRPNGCGESTIGEWPAFLPLNVLLDLLRAAGYGSPTEPQTPVETPAYIQWRREQLGGAA
jgi:hypothetical protein